MICHHHHLHLDSSFLDNYLLGGSNCHKICIESTIPNFTFAPLETLTAIVTPIIVFFIITALPFQRTWSSTITVMLIIAWYHILHGQVPKLIIGFRPASVWVLVHQLSKSEIIIGNIIPNIHICCCMYCVNYCQISADLLGFALL